MTPFASASLLLWGIAAAIPVVIHLWSRRRHEEHAWAAMAFLMAAMRRHARRARFQEWLLLALRIAVLVLFAVTLADPRTDGHATSIFPLAGDEPTHHVLVIDNSYSMDQRHGERTSLERARESALAMLKAAPQGDGFSLVLLADPATVVLDEPVFDIAMVAQELNALRAGPTGADLVATLARVRESLAKTRQRIPRLTRRHVVVFSDMARNTWDPGNRKAGDWRRPWEELSDTAVIEVRDVGPRSTQDLGNIAIVELRHAVASDVPRGSHSVHVGGEGQLEAVLRNFGARETTANVEFQVDGRPIAAPAVVVPARGEALATAKLRFDMSGDRVAKAALRAVSPPDSLPWDDQRWLVIPVRERVEVLCVEGGLDEARFVALALAPETRRPTFLAGSPALRVVVASEAALLDRPLSGYDLIALCNVARFSDSESEALREYVYRGGRLAIFSGDRVDTANYNTRLGGRSRRLLPARLSPAVTHDELPIDPRAYRDPLVDPFRGQERAGLLSTPIWCYLPATVFDINTSKVAVAFQNGDPWLVHEPIGAGHVWLSTTAVAPSSIIAGSNPSRPWNAWATWPSFVPLMQTLLRESLAGRSAARNAIVGEAITGTFILAASDWNLVDNSVNGNAAIDMAAVTVEVPPTVATETVETRRIAAERAGAELRWGISTAEIPGVYVARPIGIDGREVSPELNRDELPPMSSERSGSSPAVIEQRFAVNLDVRESDPQRIDVEDLPASVRESLLKSEQDNRGAHLENGSGAAKNVAAIDGDTLGEDGVLASGTSGGRRPWFRPLLTLIVAALVGESWLAWRLGRRGG